MPTTSVPVTDFVSSVLDEQPKPAKKARGAKMSEVAAKSHQGKKTAAKVLPVKKENKKKVTKAPSTGVRGHAYGFTAEGKKKLSEKLSAQGSFIVNYLTEHGPSHKATIAAAAKKAPKEFPCTQPHDRAVGFYLSKWKTAGILEFAAV